MRSLILLALLAAPAFGATPGKALSSLVGTSDEIVLAEVTAAVKCTPELRCPSSVALVSVATSETLKGGAAPRMGALTRDPLCVGCTYLLFVEHDDSLKTNRLVTHAMRMVDDPYTRRSGFLVDKKVIPDSLEIRRDTFRRCGRDGACDEVVVSSQVDKDVLLRHIRGLLKTRQK